MLQTKFLGDDVRLPLRPAHRDLLSALTEEGILVYGGPFEDSSGGMLIFDAPMQRVQEYIDADPYLTCADVEIVGLREWVPMAGVLANATK